MSSKMCSYGAKVMYHLIWMVSCAIWCVPVVWCLAIPGRIDTDCTMLHPQTKYCTADFVVKAALTPLASNSTIVDIAGWQALQLHIKAQIKTNQDMIQMEDDALEIMLVTDSLRQRIHLGEKYIISGNILHLSSGERYLSANECSWLQSWSTVAHRHRASIRKHKFDDACQCQIIQSSPFHGRPLTPTHDRHCQIHYEHNTDLTLNDNQSAMNDTAQCYRDHTHCGPRKLTVKRNNKTSKASTSTTDDSELSTARKEHKSPCRWSRNAELDACLQEVRAKWTGNGNGTQIA